MSVNLKTRVQKTNFNYQFSKLVVIASIAVFSLFVFTFSSARVEASEPIKSEMYIGDYEFSKDSTGYSEVKYVESVSGKIIKERKANETSFKKKYYYTDHQGSSIAVLNEQGTKIPEQTSTKLRYFPYGEQITAEDPTKLPIDDTYTGQKRDSESDLMFYNARLYDPSIGVFLQADSVADGLNKYAYVSGNPINATDPTGHYEVDNDDKLLTPTEIKANLSSEIKSLESRHGIVFSGSSYKLDMYHINAINNLLSTYKQDSLGGVEFNFYYAADSSIMGFVANTNLIKINSKYLKKNSDSKFENIPSLNGVDLHRMTYDQLADYVAGLYRTYDDSSIEYTLAHEIDHVVRMRTGNRSVNEFEDIMFKKGQGTSWYNVDELQQDPIIYNNMRKQLTDLGLNINEFTNFYGVRMGFTGSVVSWYSTTNSQEALAEYAGFYRLTLMKTGYEPTGSYTNINYPMELNKLFRY